MAIDKEQLEKRLPLLVPINSLSIPHQREVIQKGEMVEFAKGSYVFNQGDQDNFSYYLLQGELDLSANGQSVSRQQGGSEQSLYALSQLRPRQMSARALTSVIMFRTDKPLVDRLLTLEQSGELGGHLQVEEIDSEEQGDWMTTMLQSELFSRIPAVNIQKIFALMEEVEYGPGETVIRQGDPGDYYYVIRKGRCEVNVRSPGGTGDIKVAELKDGDSFGEEALVSDARRNASITMITAGSLMRLTKENFVELIRKPILREVSFARASEFLGANGRWIDVRMPDEVSDFSIEGSLHLPLKQLRLDMHTLDRALPYVTYCDTGSRSSVAAFVLAEHGFDVCNLKGGLEASPFTRDGAAPAPAAAPIPAAPDVAPPAPVATAATAGRDSVDAQVEVSSLRAEVERADMQLEALEKQQAEAVARQKAQEEESRRRLAEESRKLQAKAQQADLALQEARRLKQEAESASRDAQQNAERERAALEQKILAMQEQARRELEAERGRMEAQLASSQEEASKAARSREEMEERLRLQQERMEEESRQSQNAMREAMEERQRVEREALESAASQIKQQLDAAEQAKRQADEERRRVEETARAEIEAARRQHAEEAARAAEALAEVQRLREELEAARASAQAVAARQQQEEEQRLNALKEQTERLLKEKEEALKAEYARQASELEQLRAMKEQAEAQLQEEKQRMEMESSEVMQKLQQALRDKDDFESQQRQLGAAASAREEELRRREQELQAQVEARLKEVQAMKDEAEARMREEKHRLEAEASEAQEKLRQALADKQKVESEQQALGREASEREQEMARRERDMRDQLERRLREERKKLEAEFARNAEELERARREREAAEAARQAAEEESQRIIEEYRQELRAKRSASIINEADQRPPESAELPPTDPALRDQLMADIRSVEKELEDLYSGAARPAPAAPKSSPAKTPARRTTSEPAPRTDGREQVMDAATIKKLMEQRRALQARRIQAKANQARRAVDNDDDD